MTDPISGCFIHPYNFVRLPGGDALKNVIRRDTFWRGPSAPHDVYDSNRNTGYIDCELTTYSPWFIPDPRKVHKPRDHATLGYFTLDEVAPGAWKHDRPGDDATVPAIPGASLRGMVRSIFEAATLSCFSVFDSGRLDFRIGYSPDHQGTLGKGSSRGSARYIPCRVLEYQDNGPVRIQLLNGRFASDGGNRTAALPVVLVDAYSPKVLYEHPPRSGNQISGTQCPNAYHPDRTAVIAICSRALSTKERITVTGERIPLFRYRKVTKPLLPIESPTSFDFSTVDYDPATEAVVFGYVHRTGPNIENKHDERLFFRGNAPFNLPSAQRLTDERLRQRAIEFFADQQDIVFVRPEIVRDLITMLKGYVNRNAKRISNEPPRHISGENPPPYVSDFVVRHEKDVRIQIGDLFYALVEEVPDQLENQDQKFTVRGLYPVAIPRLSHEETRGDLLHSEFYPCSRRHEKCARCSRLDSLSESERELCNDCLESWKCLCPACRVFGWTRDLSFFRREDRERLKGSADRVDAVAGHVRFSHGTLVGSWDKSSRQKIEAIPLRILGSPHPTATGFYLQPKKGWNEEIAKRWPPVTGLRNDRNPVANLPAYRQSEARLRGRKFYRRRAETTIDSLKNPQQSDQNQTVHVLPSNLTFKFRVHFDNLSAAELGALLFALELAVPDDWKSSHGKLPADAQFFHALGHGKPLGMGCCSIKVAGIVVDGADRYAADRFQGISSGAAPRQVTDADRQPFFEEWTAIRDQPELIQMRSELLEMLAPIPGGIPMDYPPVRIRDGAADFRWWKEEKRTGALLPQPIDERAKPDCRLPCDEGLLKTLAQSQQAALNQENQGA